MEQKEKFDFEYNLQDVLMPCIYFLFDKGKIVYVGQTQSGLKRVLSHTDKKKFDTIKLIRCSVDELDELETYYIIKYQPFYNNQLTNTKNALAIKEALHKDYGIKFLRTPKIQKWILENVEYIVFKGDIYVSMKVYKEAIDKLVKLYKK